MKSKILGWLALGLLAGPMVAQAAVVITIERLSDTSARITGSGSLASPSTLSVFWGFGDGVFEVNDSQFGKKDEFFLAESGGTLSLGNCGVNVIVGNWNLFNQNDYIGFTWDSPCTFPGNSIVSGTSTFNRGFGSDGNVIWGQVGSTGKLFASGPEISAFEAGSWSIVSARAVPEPGTLALLGLGLAGLGLNRRRKAN